MTNQSMNNGPSLRKRGRIESAINSAAKTAVSSALSTAGPLGSLGNQIAPAVIDSITDRLFNMSVSAPSRRAIANDNRSRLIRGGESMNPRPRKGNPNTALRRQRLIAQGAKNKKPSFQNVSSLPGPPVAIASQISGQKYQRGLRAQVDTDLSGKGMKVDSERVKFSDMVQVAIGLDATPHVQQPFNAGSGTFLGAVLVSPHQISPRLTQIEETYGYYAFREICFTYVPYVGTGTAGAIGFALDMAFNQSFPSVTTGIDLTAVLQHEESIAAPIWERSSVSMKFTGSRLWATSGPASDVPNDYYQAFLWGCTSNAAASTNFGRLLVTGIVDFYKQVEVTSTPTLRIQGIWDSFLKREWLAYRVQSGSEDISFRDFCLRYSDSIKNRELSRGRKAQSVPVLLYDPEKKLSD